MTRGSRTWCGSIGALWCLAAGAVHAQSSNTARQATLSEIADLPISVRVRRLLNSDRQFAPVSMNGDRVLQMRRSLRRAGLSVPIRWANVGLVVSIADRTLLALVGKDTVFSAPVGVAHGLTLAYGGRRWKFQTPKGGRRVLRKVVDPVWTPPDWHYAEAALANDLRLSALPTQGVKLKDGSRVVVKNGVIGLDLPGQGFAQLPTDEHVVFDERLFIPPLGTQNRRISGVLGSIALDLGGGYLIHGTSNETSVGRASSHGCLRMHEEDLAWLYDHVPVGARVTIR